MSLLRTALRVREGDTRLAPARPRKSLFQLLSTIEALYQIRDLDSLLERVLYEARRFTSADAGTLYLVAGERLYFSYMQNDTLFTGADPRDRYVYASQSLPIDRRSLAGYVAQTGESLMIDDVYDIKSDVSYHFNPDYDQKTSYKTRSILIVPLVTPGRPVLGVLQLINAKDETAQVLPFSSQDRLTLIQFAQGAASAIERAKLSREMVLRMVEMAELRDPFETGQHAKRVGACSVELYDKWARAHGVPTREIMENRDILRTAAMLHDVGKVAISEVILKKGRNLSTDELLTLRLHTVFGARLFRNTTSVWDKITAEVVLNHHERWDGTGYPGRIEDIRVPEIRPGPGKKGEEIPLSARIVALADVYDALISERSYKPAWEEERVLSYIRREAGGQFDPELAELFVGIRDVLKVIREKYSF
jgi:HD-GYP domain-containing protein (c-di-GMP phosphodiesterase class II)